MDTTEVKEMDTLPPREQGSHVLGTNLFNILHTLRKEKENLNMKLVSSFRIECLFSSFALFKGTASTISRHLLCKYGNARFTTVPLKALSGQVWIIYEYL